MAKLKLHKWEKIKPDFHHNLLLGNGASVAVTRSFDYKSLYLKALNDEIIGSNLQQLFTRFKTRNFEVVLKLLSDTRKVNGILEIDEEETAKAYKQIRSALVETIRGVHPQYPDVQNYLGRIADFMLGFETVISLNYDLIVYWAMLLGNKLKKGRNRFKDCFVRDVFGDLVFENAFDDYLMLPHEDLGKATLIFHPHGNLVLATEPLGSETKLSKSLADCLLDTILAKWQLGNYTPLFVSEGKSRDKIHAIEKSNYLTNVYNRVLATVEESLIIYGWSFGDQDEHIIKALDRGRLKRIAISVYTGASDFTDKCEEVLKKIKKTRHLKDCEIFFFEHDCEGCWIY